jgi:hypothetical protein
MTSNKDYTEWSDQDLADELEALDRTINQNVTTIASARRSMNISMNMREELLDIIAQRAQRRGWNKNARN